MRDLNARLLLGRSCWRTEVAASSHPMTTEEVDKDDGQSSALSSPQPGTRAFHLLRLQARVQEVRQLLLEDLCELDEPLGQFNLEADVSPEERQRRQAVHQARLSLEHVLEQELAALLLPFSEELEVLSHDRGPTRHDHQRSPSAPQRQTGTDHRGEGESSRLSGASVLFKEEKDDDTRSPIGDRIDKEAR